MDMKTPKMNGNKPVANGHPKTSVEAKSAAPGAKTKKKAKTPKEPVLEKKRQERFESRYLWATLPPRVRPEVPQNLVVEVRTDDRNKPTGDFLSEVFTKEGELLAEVFGAGGRETSVKLTQAARSLETFTEKELNQALKRARSLVSSEVVSDSEES